MPDRRVRYTPLVQDCTQKSVPLITRITAAVEQIDTTARTLGIPRHHILKAAFKAGLPLVLAELTAKTAAVGGEE